MESLRTQGEREQLADALGDAPETAIPAHFLRRGLADAYVVGTSRCFDGAIVRSHALPSEPWCFGEDPSIMWRLLRPFDGRGLRGMSPNVPSELARPLASLIEDETGLQVHHYGEIYHTLIGPVEGLAAPEVRPLNLGDTGLLAAYRSNPHEMGFATLEDLLTDGVAAGAVVRGRLVSLAHSNAMTASYGDISVATDEAWRGMGFASAAASIVALRIQDRGLTPVWSAGEDNPASLRVAAKLGFAEVSRRVYLHIHRATGKSTTSRRPA